MISLGELQPSNFPVNSTPMYLGAFNSQGKLAMTSTASAEKKFKKKKRKKKSIPEHKQKKGKVKERNV